MSPATDVTSITVQFFESGADTDSTDPDDLCGPYDDEDSPMSIGCVAVVTATAQYEAITPIIGAILGPMTFEARSEGPVEFRCPNPDVALASCPRLP
jgi:hypothetical protein